MGLFSFLSPKVENPKKTIFDLFLINIKELPDSSFIDEGYATNEMGSEFQLFTSDLDYLECGIFNKIEILKFTEGGMNVTFNSGISSTLNIAKLKELVNSLYQIYGNDSDGRGKFTNQDINEYYGVYESFRRNWIQKTPFINVNAFRDDNDIILSILGIENDSPNYNNQEEAHSTMTTIDDLFKVKLKELPDKRFNAFGKVTMKDGSFFYSFDLTLNYLECGIFSAINVWQYPEGGKTVRFLSNDLLSVKLGKVKELVNSLFNLYGIDSQDNGEFTDKERNEFYGHHELYLRIWWEESTTISINIDRENNEFELMIAYQKVE